MHPRPTADDAPNDRLDDGRPAAQAERPLLIRLELIEIMVGAALCGVAAWFWFAAAAIDDEGGPGIGPDGFPRGIALLLGVLALLMTGRALRRLALGETGPVVETGRPWGVLGGICLVVAFPAVMQQLGYYPAMGLFIPALLLAAGYRNVIGIALYAGGFLVFTRLVFGLILKTPLP